MIIHRLQVTAFAGLRNLSLNFESGPNLIYGLNESGKSSLLGFVQSMFYGLGRRQRDVEKDLRRRYQPWQGGAFGGSIEFSLAGRRYLLERQFGSDRKEDRCVLRDALSGRDLPLSQREAPGEDLLRLSLGEFRNTAWVRALETGSEAGRSLEDKLNALAGDGLAEQSHSSILERLEHARKILGACDETTGRGRLPELRGTILTLQERYEAALRADAKRSELWQQKRQLEREQLELEHELADLHKQKALAEQLGVVERWQQAERLKSRIDSLARKRVAISQENEICREPSLRDLDRMGRQRQSSQQAQSAYELALSVQRMRERENDKFIEQARAVIGELGEERDRLARKRQKEADREPLREPQGARFPLSLILLSAAIFLALGLILHGHSLIFAALFFVLAAVGPIIVMFYTQRLERREQQRYRQRLEKRRRAAVAARELEQHVERLEWDLQHLEAKVHQAETLLDEQKYLVEEKERAWKQSLAALQLELATYLRHKPELADLDQVLQELRDYALLRQDHSQNQSSYETDLQNLLQDESWDELEARASKAQEWIREHQVDYGTFPKYRAQEHDQREANAQAALMRVRETHVLALKQLEQLEQIEDAASLERQIVALTEEEQRLLRRAQALDLALYLSGRVRERYEQTIRPALNERAQAYLSRLSDARYDEVLIDRELRMQVKAPEDSHFHQEAQYSSGTRDLLWLSLRLALIDLIETQAERLPLMLDDCLSQLDQERQARCLDLLSTLSAEKTWQILCFSSDRKLYELAAQGTWARQELGQTRLS